MDCHFSCFSTSGKAINMLPSTQFKVCLNCQSMVHLVTNGCWQRSQSVLEKLQFYLPLVQQYGQGISRISTTSNRIIHWKFEQLYDLDCVNQLMCRSNCVLSSYTAHSKTFTNRKKLALQQILFRVPAARYCFWLQHCVLYFASYLTCNMNLINIKSCSRIRTNPL